MASKINELEEIEYVIYCRKSTEKTTGKQTQSIPDQINACMEFAERVWLKIKERPSDFSMFESEQEIYEQDHDDEPLNRETYMKYRNFFIIKEQLTWKIPQYRPKFNKLMKLIEQWKIKGLLSYSPDRQARNMVDWWYIIHYADSWLVDLKYTNFNFVPNSNWLMQLWISFVLSKQYSDNLSDTVLRWLKSSTEKCKAWGTIKLWYVIDEATKWHKPDGRNYDLMRKAFELKLYQNKSDNEICNRLNAAWLKREKTKKPLDITSLNRIWRDPFYYWVLIRGQHHWDLIKNNPLYKPMISKDEYDLLYKRYQNKQVLETFKKKKDIYECVSPIPDWVLVTQDWWHKFSRYIPSSNRHKKKLIELQKTNPNATLADIIKPHQIYYTVTNKKAKQMDIHYTDIDEAIKNKLAQLHLNEEWYEAFHDYFSNELKKVRDEKLKEKAVYDEQIKKLKREKDEFMAKVLTKQLSREERRVYEWKLREYDIQIKNVLDHSSSIIIDDREEVAEFEALAYFLHNAEHVYEKANYVQRAKIVELFISNIFIDNKKSPTVQVRPSLQSLTYALGSPRLKQIQGLRELNPRRGALETPALPLS